MWIDEDETFMLELECLDYLAGLEALYADADPLRRAVNDGADVFEVGEEPAGVDARYLLAYAAFFLGQAAALDGSSGNGFFTADRTDF